MSSDPYSIINFSGRYVIVDHDRLGTECFINITNLLNSRYYNIPIGGAESIWMALQDPLRFLMGVQVGFQ